MGAPAASQSAIKRALAAAQDRGLAIVGYSVTREGTIHVTLAGASAAAVASPDEGVDAWDQATGTAS